MALHKKQGTTMFFGVLCAPPSQRTTSLRSHLFRKKISVSFDSLFVERPLANHMRLSSVKWKYGAQQSH